MNPTKQQLSPPQQFAPLSQNLNPWFQLLCSSIQSPKDNSTSIQDYLSNQKNQYLFTNFELPPVYHFEPLQNEGLPGIPSHPMFAPDFLRIRETIGMEQMERQRRELHEQQIAHMHREYYNSFMQQRN